jgi:hypothetical protein
LRQTRGAKKILRTVLKTGLKTKKKLVYFGFREIRCGLFLKGIFSVFGRFIEEYLRNLTCWEKSKHRFGLSTSKLSKNRSKDKIVLGSESIKRQIRPIKL